MTGFALGVGIDSGLCRALGAVVDPIGPAPTTDWRNMIRAYGPGNNGALLSDGTAGTQAQTDAYQNESGASAAAVCPVLVGWRVVINAADELTPSDYTAMVEIEYPTGSGYQMAAAAMVVAPGATVVAPSFTLATAIPAGATFNLRTTAVLTVGQKVPRAGDSSGGNFFRVAGLLSQHARRNVMALGDSIFNNNGQPSRAAAQGKLPVCQIAIISSTGYQNAANIARRVALAKALGVTHLLANYQANDQEAGRTLAQLQAAVTSIADAFAVEGIRTIWTTATPRSSAVNQTGSAFTVSGSTTVTLVNAGTASRYAVDEIYNITGAATPSRNGFHIITAVNTGANTITFRDATTPDGTDANTVTVTSNYGYLSHQTLSGNRIGGAASIWAQYNAWIKTRPGNVTDFIAIDEAMAVSVTDPRYKVAPLPPFLRRAKPLLTVSGIPFTNIIVFTTDGDTYVTQWATGGRLIWLTGANAGQVVSINDSANPGQGNLTIALASSAGVIVGDTFAVQPPDAQFGQSIDGLHPSAFYTGFGGTPHMQSIIAAKYQAMVS